MSQITAVSSLGNVLANQIPVDMLQAVAHLEPASFPLTRILTLAKENIRSVKQPKFEHLRQQLIGRQTQVNNGAGYSDSATSVVVDDGSIFSSDSLVEVIRTGEIMLVSSVSTNTLTVVRGMGETAAAALVDNDYVLRLGTAREEGGAKKDPNVRQLTTDYNYCQISRTPFGVTGTAEHTEMYSGDELPRLRKEAGIEHALDIEHNIVFGERGIVNGTGNQPRRMTRGLIQFITGGSGTTYAVGGSLTESGLNQSFLEGLFRYGSDTKLLFASARLCTALDKFGRDYLQVDREMSSKIGVAVREYVSTHGVLKVIKHKLLEGNTYTGYGIAVDPKYIKLATFRPTTLRKAIQTPGDDQMIEEYLTECGLDVTQPQAFGLITGVTGAA